MSVTEPAQGSREDLLGFRVVLAAGAVLALGLGAAGLFGGGVLRSLLGPEMVPRSPGFVGLSRMFGSAMLALGVGYALASAHPLRNRGLLVVLFAAPLAGAVALIVAAAKDEFSPVRGGIFAGVELVWCLLYFRLYPRTGATPLEEPAADGDRERPGG